MTTRQILVTGGFGFLGSHLVERLLSDEGARVHVVDNLSTSPIHVDAYLRGLGNPPALTHEICSVEDFAKARATFPAFDEIYHLASVVGPVGVLAHAGKITRSITDDTYHVLHIAEKTGARLCDVSTSEVYGGGRDGYCSENDAKIITPKVSVRLEYAVAKLACEIALINTTKVSDLFAVIIRPFNISGPRQAPKGGFVIPRFIRQALVGEPITVYGDGSMIRALHPRRRRRRRHRPSPPERPPRRGLQHRQPRQQSQHPRARRAHHRPLGSKSRVNFVDPKALFGPLFERPTTNSPTPTNAQRELGWKPQFDLDQVIRDTLEYIRAERSD
jgi:UDP-glucose 4-epimerase